MTEDELAAIERRLNTVMSTEWKRLQHYIEDENDFSAHARGDMAALVAEVRRLRAAAHQKCGLCDEVGPCEPEGYDWAWRCADWAACQTRFRVAFPNFYRDE